MVVSLALFPPTIEDYFSYDIGALYYDYPGASSQESDGTDGTGGSGTRGMEFLEWYGSVGISNLPADLGAFHTILVIHQQDLPTIMIILIII